MTAADLGTRSHPQQGRVARTGSYVLPSPSIHSDYWPSIWAKRPVDVDADAWAAALNAEDFERARFFVLLEINDLRNQFFPGTSLRRLWDSTGDRGEAKETMLISLTGGFGRPEEPRSRGDMWSVIADPFQYILNGDSKEEVYDFRIDPRQERELLSAGEGAEQLELFRATTSTSRPQTP